MSDNDTSTRRKATKLTAARLLGAIGVASGTAAADDDVGENEPTDGPAITTSALLIGIRDWRKDNIDTDRLLVLVRYWRNEETLTEIIDDWRNDELSTNDLLYIVDLVERDRVDEA